jgi:integrase/recombinase XerD
MSLAKQAKTLSEAQIKAALASAESPRDRAMVLLSCKAGLRAKEIAALQWPMLTDAQGALGEAIALTNDASKGKHGGREIPLHGDLRAALAALHETSSDGVVIRDSRGRPMTANAMAVWFHRLYASLGFKGASSHSGRRTFITRAARKIVEAGGSLRDVQQLAGHASLQTTQRYIEGSTDAKRRVVAMI